MTLHARSANPICVQSFIPVHWLFFLYACWRRKNRQWEARRRRRNDPRHDTSYRRARDRQTDRQTQCVMRRHRGQQPVRSVSKNPNPASALRALGCGHSGLRPTTPSQLSVASDTFWRYCKIHKQRGCAILNFNLREHYETLLYRFCMFWCGKRQWRSDTSCVRCVRTPCQQNT